MKPAFFPLLFILALLLRPPASDASGNFVLKGRVVDTGGKPVEGGEVFVYSTPQTRRPADFISARSDGAGFYRTELPAGRYWVVARVRDGAGYGPLALGKRHSGEALEIEGEAGSAVDLDFIVADVRDMARSRRKTGEDYRMVEGRILDPDGKPVRAAYAFARVDGKATGLPEFISPWSDEEGRYSLYLPAGRACLGAAVAYPPEEGAPCAELIPDAAIIDVAKDLRLHYIDKKNDDERQNSKDID